MRTFGGATAEAASTVAAGAAAVAAEGVAEGVASDGVGLGVGVAMVEGVERHAVGKVGGVRGGRGTRYRARKGGFEGLLKYFFLAKKVVRT